MRNSCPGPGHGLSSNTPPVRAFRPVPTAFDDPMGNGQYPVRRTRTALYSSGDQSMPDYSHSSTPASSRNNSNIHDTNSTVVGALLNDGRFLDPTYYSPSKPVVSNGIVAPANTRVGSAANTPQSSRKASTALETQGNPAVYSQIRSVSLTTRDPLKATMREPSNTSTQSRFSEKEYEHCGQLLDATIKTTPAKDVKGRKEGRSGEIAGVQKAASCEPATNNDKENVKQNSFGTKEGSEGKRKRPAPPNFTSGRMLSEGHANSSPTRKVSRTSHQNQDIDDLTDEGVVTRVPLADVGNSL